MKGKLRNASCRRHRKRRNTWRNYCGIHLSCAGSHVSVDRASIAAPIPLERDFSAKQVKHQNKRRKRPTPPGDRLSNGATTAVPAPSRKQRKKPRQILRDAASPVAAVDPGSSPPPWSDRFYICVKYSLHVDMHTMLRTIQLL